MTEDRSMAGEIMGSARFVENRIHGRVAGRFAIAISKADYRGRRVYDVYYSDSQKIDSDAPHTVLERVKRQGYTVLVTETTRQPERKL